MDCSTATAAEDLTGLETQSNDDHLLPSNDSSCSSSSSSALPTARVISVCEIQPSFYLTAPIRRLFDSTSDSSPTNDQSTPYSTISAIEHENNCLTPSLSDYHPRHQVEYSDMEDENNKENQHRHSSTLSQITSTSATTAATSSSSDPPGNTEVKRSSIYKLILKNSIYK